MKILLVNPPYTNNVYSGFKPAVQVQIPLGLAYIASALDQGEGTVEVLDANAENLSLDATIARINSSNADAVGITTVTPIMHIVSAIAAGLRRRPGRKIIVGGPHATFFPEETLRQNPNIDIVVIGEGEDTAAELLSREFTGLDRIRGIAYRDTPGIRINEKRDRIEDLDRVPFPARHLFKLELYRQGALWNIGIENRRVMTLITSRGCPSRCSYCSSLAFWGPRVRFRSVENIVNEIAHLQAAYDAKQIAIFDDTFLANYSRVHAFCDALLDRGIDIHWWCYGKLDRPYPAAMLKKMKRAGCFGLNFGVESGNQQILDGVSKNIKLPVVEEIVRSVHKEGFLIMSSFMVGLPGDTETTVRQTIDFSIRLNPHIAQYCITTPFPGTELYDMARRKGWMEGVASWSEVGEHQDTKFRNDDLSSGQINALYKLAHRKFYFRPGYFFLLLRRFIRHPRELKGFLLAGIYMVTDNFGGGSHEK
ncbi:MAG TPA: radical SAM protein [Candidatus Omnitrophota bacterium]|nr:radical SAM protein [Candidatus Omnitrophota bacterium]